MRSKLALIFLFFIFIYFIFFFLGEIDFRWWNFNVYNPLEIVRRYNKRYINKEKNWKRQKRIFIEQKPQQRVSLLREVKSPGLTNDSPDIHRRRIQLSCQHIYVLSDGMVYAHHEEPPNPSLINIDYF